MSATQTAPGEEMSVTRDALLRQLPEDRTLFEQNFERKPFAFHHSLDRHPLFTLDALLEAAERMQRRKNGAHYESGEPQVDGWFGQRPEGKTLVDALAEIKGGKNWIILKRIHEDPVYGALLQDMIPELEELTRVDFRHNYTDPTMTVFCTSPGRITPYHMDAETNFLAQIHGTKHAYLYDSFDPTVLSAQDLEAYWTGALPHPDLPQHLPHGSWEFLLEPGVGVFNPASFPHWLQNGADVSISVSINFTPTQDMRIGAYRTNRFLRKVGLKPAVPGQKPGMDRAKAMTFGKVYLAAREAVKNAKAKKS